MIKWNAEELRSQWNAKDYYENEFKHRHKKEKEMSEMRTKIRISKDGKTVSSYQARGKRTAQVSGINVGQEEHFISKGLFIEPGEKLTIEVITSPAWHDITEEEFLENWNKKVWMWENENEIHSATLHGFTPRAQTPYLFYGSWSHASLIHPVTGERA